MGPRQPHSVCGDDLRVPWVHEEHGQRPLHTKVWHSPYFLATFLKPRQYVKKPRPWGFPGLRPGDRWCLCSRRWRYLAQLGLLLQHLHQCLRCPWAWTLKDLKQISLCFPLQASDERGQSSPGGIGGFSQKRSSSELNWGDEQSIGSNWGRFAIKIQVERTCEPYIVFLFPWFGFSERWNTFMILS